MTARVSTGVEGLDKLIEGGFPEQSSILVCGMPGTGKTIFALQYLFAGTKTNEKALYVTVDENADKIRDQGKQFGWDIPALEKKGLFTFLQIPVDQARYNIVREIQDAVKNSGAKRMVVDSVSVLGINASMFSMQVNAQRLEEGHYILPENVFTPSFTGEFVGQFMYLIMSRINKLGLNVIFIADSPNETSYTKDGVTEFICDGLLYLRVLNLGNTMQRSLELRKMRNTNFLPGLFSMEIGKQGIKLSKLNY